ncbi:hypothetical protein [Chryseobacterium kwangjuense]|uniref:Uncharacterized protein n=1 Tax=Chryseobacterium kwangjuense TaxID=267125 RepID=A0A135WIX7_9FLAO|nr:hypothetical protein [Chryseobacterium kwangjuense]KXH84851.1 hypothetical protein AU378_03590 [Chryseobacterium kwangjuense]
MERDIKKLPVIKVDHDADFHVDAVNQILIDTQNHSNIIDARRMNHCEDSLEAVFDRYTRNLALGYPEKFKTSPERYLQIYMHRLEIYDREGAKLLWEYEGEPFMRSITVEVAIEGIKYMYDQDYRLFREKDNPYNVLNRPNMWFNRNGEYGCYFDRQLGCAAMVQEGRQFQREGTFPPHFTFLKMSEITQKVRNALNNAYYKMKATNSKGRRMH